MESSARLYYKVSSTNTWESVFTVPGGKFLTMSTVMVSNKSGASGTFGIGIIPNGGTPASPNDEDTIHESKTIENEESYPFTEGWVLYPGDQLIFRASHAKITLMGFGVTEDNS